MNFQVGQEVTIRRNLGETLGYSKSEYYYKGNLRNVPLGVKATIDRIDSKNKIHLKLKNESYGISGGWYVHPYEITSPEEQAQREAEQQERIGSLLETVLLSKPVERKETVTREKPFEPKFNVREEFALWMREQFPGLFKTTKAYHGFEKRKDEVYKAARLACKHGIRTTNSCVSGKFETYLDDLKDYSNSNGDFSKQLRGLVRLIEHVSANLPSKQGRHYGTELADKEDF